MGRKYLLVIPFVLVMGCENFTPPAPAPEDILAEPLPELTNEQLQLHIKGDGEFARVFGASDGLGPIFVQNACESCHVGDGKGSPFNALTRFGTYTNGEWDPLFQLGGPQLQHRAIAGYEAEKLPPGVSSTQFIAPNVTGLGYLDALEDNTLLEMADPEDMDGDGISGRVNYIEKPPWLSPDKRYHQLQPNGKYIGRFGRKGGAVDLLHQTVNAYKEDMGITSDFDPKDPVNYNSSGLSDDGVPDPEVSAGIVRQVAFYIQTLKAPPRRNENSPDVLAGESIFRDIGCISCHTETLTTGPSEIAALNRKDFHPYTDMLFHDMGPELDDGYTEGSVSTSEWRTSPLWGLGLQQDSQGGTIYLMHDGRARSLEEAILLHGGEGSESRENFKSLNPEQKTLLYKFLESL